MKIVRLLEPLLSLRLVAYSLLDPRTRDWPLVNTSIYPLVVCGGYLWFVYSLGPRLMKNRAAFDLRWPIRLHNLFMIAANAYFMRHFLAHSYLADYSLFCQGMTYTTDAHSMAILGLAWWYLLVRSVDLLDTVFFILRKKHDHVTFQHVSHHFCCIFSGHLWLSLGMDGQTLLGLNINAAVHVIMYTYYLLASFGPKMRRYLWWKKHLTVLQICQHFIVILHGLIPYIYECNYPQFYIYIALPQGLLGTTLFLNFYVVRYTGRKSLLDFFFVSATPCALSDGDREPVKCNKLD